MNVHICVGVHSDDCSTCKCTAMCSSLLKTKQQLKLLIVNMRNAFCTNSCWHSVVCWFVVYDMRTVHWDDGYRTIGIQHTSVFPCACRAHPSLYVRFPRRLVIMKHLHVSLTAQLSVTSSHHSISTVYFWSLHHPHNALFTVNSMVCDIWILIYFVIYCHLYEHFRNLIWRYSYKLKGMLFCQDDRQQHWFTQYDVVNVLP